MEFAPGQIVMSRKGRDVTRWYVVVGQAGGRVLLADGGKRTLAQPKAKNPLHVAPTKTILPPEQRQADAAIRAALAAYEAARPNATGG